MKAYPATEVLPEVIQLLEMHQIHETKTIHDFLQNLPREGYLIQVMFIDMSIIENKIYQYRSFEYVRMRYDEKLQFAESVTEAKVYHQKRSIQKVLEILDYDGISYTVIDLSK